MGNLAGTRIRTNNVFGTLTDNPLTSGATTMNSAGLADLAAVSSNHAVIVLDPLRVAGAPEIVIVTAHTAAATSATVVRAAYGTTARQHNLSTLWIHAPTIDDLIQICTSSTRPTDIYRGQSLFETDTNRFVARSTADVWQQNGLFFDPPACFAYRTASQSINSGAFTPLQLNLEEFDTDTMHDNATNNSRITCNTAGVFVINGQILYGGGAGGERYTVFLEERRRISNSWA